MSDPWVALIAALCLVTGTQLGMWAQRRLDKAAGRAAGLDHINRKAGL